MTKRKINKKKKEMRKEENVLPILIYALIVSLVISALFYFDVVGQIDFGNDLDVLEKELLELEELEEDLEDMKEFSLQGFTEIDVEISTDFAILRDKSKRCDGMIVAIDPNQGYSIQQGLESKVSFRPLSHDSIRDILEMYEIEIVAVKITDLRRGVYFGRMILDDGEKIVNLDVRPSDGIAVAVRTDTPIYISESLLEEFGENVC